MEGTPKPSIRVREVPVAARAVLWFVLAAQLLCVGALEYLLTRAFSPTTAGIALVPLALVFSIAQSARQLHQHYRGKEQDARVDARGLLLDGRLRRRAKRTKSVELEPPNAKHSAWRVVLVSVFGYRLQLDAASEDDARRLVKELDFAPTQRLGAFTVFRCSTFGFWLTSLAPALVFIAVMVASAKLHVLRTMSSPDLMLCSIPLVLVPMFLLRAMRTEVEVGLDGVRLRYGLRGRLSHGAKERFVPFKAIASLQVRGKTIVLREREKGEEVFYAAAGHEALLLRVEEARRVAMQQAGVSPMLAAVPRTEDYRSAAYPRDVLLRVVEDPNQSAEARVTAAAALREKLDDDERVRVRVAAQTTASPELRGQLVELAAELPPAERRAAAHQ